MSGSYINSIVNSWMEFSNGLEIYSSGDVLYSSSPFSVPYEFTAVPPITDRILITTNHIDSPCSTICTGGTWSFGGVFRPVASAPITIFEAGQTLTDLQKDFIKSKISLINNSSQDTLDIILSDIGYAGIEFFGVKVNYIESAYSNPAVSSDITFININSTSSTFSDLSLYISSSIFSLVGSNSGTDAAFVLTDTSPSTRNITTTASLTQAVDKILTISYSELVAASPAITVSNSPTGNFTSRIEITILNPSMELYVYHTPLSTGNFGRFKNGYRSYDAITFTYNAINNSSYSVSYTTPDTYNITLISFFHGPGQHGYDEGSFSIITYDDHTGLKIVDDANGVIIGSILYSNIADNTFESVLALLSSQLDSHINSTTRSGTQYYFRYNTDYYDTEYASLFNDAPGVKSRTKSYFSKLPANSLMPGLQFVSTYVSNLNTIRDSQLSDATSNNQLFFALPPKSGSVSGGLSGTTILSVIDQINFGLRGTLFGIERPQYISSSGAGAGLYSGLLLSSSHFKTTSFTTLVSGTPVQLNTLLSSEIRYVSYISSNILSSGTIGSFASTLQTTLRSNPVFVQQVLSASASGNAGSLASTINNVSANRDFAFSSTPVSITCTGSTTYTKTYNLSIYTTMSSLANAINLNPDQNWVGIVSCSFSQANSNLSTSLLSLVPNTDFSNSDLTFTYSSTSSTTFNGQLINYPTLSSLVTAVNNIFSSHGVTLSVDSGTISYPTAIPVNLKQLQSTNVNLTTTAVKGTISYTPTITIPTDSISYTFNIDYATTGSSSYYKNIQVSFGGYTKSGADTISHSPNTFLEPNYNVFTPIIYNTENSTNAYILLRERDSFYNTYSSSPTTRYIATITYSRGSQEIITSSAPSGIHVSQWTESQGLPDVISVPLKSYINNISITDTGVTPTKTLNLTIYNTPSLLNEFCFLPVNRNNPVPQTNRIGRSFGILMDTTSAWDIMVSPECVLREYQSGDPGQFSYLGYNYSRTINDIDEDYSVEILNSSSLPAEVLANIELTYIPGKSPVKVLRINPALKTYMDGLRAASNNANGCSFNIDLLFTGNTTFIEGTCRIVIYSDISCIFDFNSCEFTWNLIDPTDPDNRDRVQNNLNLSFSQLLDCNNLNQGSDNTGYKFRIPIIFNMDGIPTVKNGYGILSIKADANYFPPIQGFAMPDNADISEYIYSGSCTSIQNDSYYEYYNQVVMYLPGNQKIINPTQDDINNNNSYMIVEPYPQTPSVDIIRDCGSSNEFLIYSIGYRFKNWVAGYRTDKVIMLFDISTSAQYSGGFPQVNFCARYRWKN